MIAGGFSICLILIMVIFVYFLPESTMIRRFIFGFLVMACGLLLASVGPQMPRWIRVVVGNMLLIVPGPIIYASFLAYCTEQKAHFDWLGWVIVALTGPAFWYWGLVDSNGINRSIVFSLAVAAINSRSAWILLRTAMDRRRDFALWIITLLFCAIVIWMFTRCVHLFFAPPMKSVSANPTHWTTVFGYIVLASLLILCLMWLEVNRLKRTRVESVGLASPIISFLQYFKNKLLLFWMAVVVILLAIISTLSVSYVNFYSYEKYRMNQNLDAMIDAYVEYTQQVISHAEATLRAVSYFYIQTGSIQETKVLMDELTSSGSDLSYMSLISNKGRILISQNSTQLNLDVSQSDHFKYHQSNSEQSLYVFSEQLVDSNGNINLQISKRMNNRDGSFGGIVLMSIDSRLFSNFFLQLIGDQKIYAAIFLNEKKQLISSIPTTNSGFWKIAPESQVWNVVSQSRSGSLEHINFIDGFEGIFNFKVIPKLPLVVFVGISEDSLSHNVNGRLRYISLIGISIIGVFLLLGFLFTMEAHRRDEQDNFMSMLSHELKTPISVILMSLSASDINKIVKDRVLQSVIDMNQIIERCLQSDRLTFGRVEINSQPVNIVTLLTEACKISSAPERLAMHIDQVPVCTTDPLLLRTIILNLLDNAFKYSVRDSMVDVCVSVQDRNLKSGVLIEVVNTIDASEAPDPARVFSKYYRGEYAKVTTGSGLGLYVAAGFATRIRGALHYKSTDSHVRFELWIPC